MKKITLLILSLLLVLFASACVTFYDPIHTSADSVITYLSDEDYNNVSTAGLENPSKDDFRKFIFNFEVKHSENVVIREVKFPNNNSWRHSLDSIDDKKRYWFGKGNEQNNDDENFVRYHRELIIYSKGLNEEEIKQALNAIHFEVYIETEEGHTTEKEYRVGNLMESHHNNKGS